MPLPKYTTRKIMELTKRRREAGATGENIESSGEENRLPSEEVQSVPPATETSEAAESQEKSSEEISLSVSSVMKPIVQNWVSSVVDSVAHPVEDRPAIAISVKCC